jgi:DNA-binding response OmpR family regulator
MNRILIAEDEARVAAFLEKGLGKNGFTTVIARDGQQVLELIEREDVDLLLLDIRMPVKDGWEVLEEVRNRGLKFPILIMTAFDDNKNRSMAMEKGANNYLTKPFPFQTLLMIVKQLLED